MQQSTSPSQYGRPSYSQQQFFASSSAVRRSRRTLASRPHSRNELSVHVVAVQGCELCSAASVPAKSNSAGKNAPPAHWPSRSCNESRRAPNPLVAIDARVAAHTVGASFSRSRSTCHRIAGSESRSHASKSVRGAIWQYYRKAKQAIRLTHLSTSDAMVNSGPVAWPTAGNPSRPHHHDVGGSDLHWLVPQPNQRANGQFLHHRRLGQRAAIERNS